MPTLPPTYTATSLLASLSTGRTAPIVAACEDEHGRSAGEYVVKLNGKMELGTDGAAFELLASLLATELGLNVPPPALIEVTRPFASGATLGGRLDVSSSIGLNFGCSYMPSMQVWPTDRSLSDDAVQPAAEVYEFDALIDNPDRRADKPNVLWSGRDFFLIDHEAAFSFLLAIGGDSEPWTLEKAAYHLSHHVFRRGLRGLLVDTSRFDGAFASLDDSKLEQIAGCLPEGWHSDRVDRVFGRLRQLHERAELFASNVRHSLQ